jgi:hypothetical protein
MVHGALPVTPDRGSLRYSDAQTRAQSQAAGSRTSSFYSTRRTTGTADRVPFDQQRSAISRATGNTASTSRGPAASSSAPARLADAAGGWRRFGDPTPRQAGSSPSSGASRPAGGSGSNSGGWDRFGNSGSSSSGAYRNANPAPARSSSPGVNRATPVVRQQSAPAPSYGGGGRSSAPAPSGGGHSSSGGSHSSGSHSSGGHR